MTTPESSSLTITTPAGINLALRRYGSGGGPTCLAIHGFGEGSYVWRDLARAMPPSWSLITVDLRGHGDSAWDASGRYDLEDYVSDFDGLMPSLGVERFSIIGHSLGARIGCILAAQLPSQVSAMALVDFGINLSETGQDRALADFIESFKPYASHADYASWFAASRPLTDPRLLDMIATQSLRARDGALYSKCDPKLIAFANKIVDETSIRAALREIQCPTLVVRGAGSAVFPPQAAVETAERLLRGELKTIPGAGHAVVVENPEVLAGELVAFLQRHATFPTGERFEVRRGFPRGSF